MANTQFKLIIEDDEGRRSVVPVEVGEVTIGRAANSTIRLNERNVSRTHTRLWAEDGRILARDLDSYNGTWVNGERLAQTHSIKEGDLLRIGDFQVELRGDGLLKPDEATDRTTLGTPEATQPGIRMDLDEDTLVSETGPNNLLPEEETIDFIREPTEAIATSSPVNESPKREEKTAIIRMSDYADVMASGPDGQSISSGEIARLICVSTQFPGVEFEIKKTEVVIGRTEENDIAVEHRSVSRHHAKITLENNRYSIADLTSANGTLVNGEEYARVELKGGDLIELGHVKFRFVPGGEPYTYTDDELELVSPAIESVRRATATVPGQVEPIHSSASQLDPKFVGGIGAALVICVIGAVMFFGADESEEPSGPVKTLVKPVDSGAVVKLLNRAQAAFDKRQWNQAEALANAALELEPTSSKALDLLEASGNEERMESLFEKAKGDIRDGNWSGAWNALSDIEKESAYASEAELLREQVRGGLISERIGEAKEAISSKDWDRARGLVDEILGLQPERPEIQMLRDAIKDGKNSAARAAQATVSKPEPKPKPVSKSSKSKLSKPSKPKTTAPVQAASKESKTPEVSGTAKEYYSSGVAALNQGAFNKSIEHFSKCIQADKKFGLCYRAMGITYARMQNGPKAARYYRLYLKVKPNAKDAGQVREFLKQYDGQ